MTEVSSRCQQGELPAKVKPGGIGLYGDKGATMPRLIKPRIPKHGHQGAYVRGLPLRRPFCRRCQEGLKTPQGVMRERAGAPLPMRR